MAIVKVIGYTFLITIIEAVALFAMKYYAKNGGLYIASAIFGLGVAPLLNYTLKYESVGLVNFIWTISSVVIMFTLGYVLFEEHVHYLHLIGIALCLCGVFLILMTHNDITGKG